MRALADATTRPFVQQQRMAEYTQALEAAETKRSTSAHRDYFDFVAEQLPALKSRD
jgi:hypothetical protein